MDQDFVGHLDVVNIFPQLVLEDIIDRPELDPVDHVAHLRLKVGQLWDLWGSPGSGESKSRLSITVLWVKEVESFPPEAAQEGLGLINKLYGIFSS